MDILLFCFLNKASVLEVCRFFFLKQLLFHIIDENIQLGEYATFLHPVTS